MVSLLDTRDDGQEGVVPDRIEMSGVKVDGQVVVLAAIENVVGQFSEYQVDIRYGDLVR